MWKFSNNKINPPGKSESKLPFIVQYNLDARAAAHHGQPRGEAEGARDRRDDSPRGHQRGRRHQLQRLGVPDDVIIETTQLHPPIIRPLSSDLYFGSISLLISILLFYCGQKVQISFF